MPLFSVTVTETYITDFTIEAETEDAAVDIAQQRCIEGDWSEAASQSCDRTSSANPLNTEGLEPTT